MTKHIYSSLYIILFCALVPLKSNTEKAITNLDYLSEVYNDSWAVIIGINKYQNMKNLKYAVSDATEIKNMFIDKYGFKEDHIRLLVDDQATRENITRGFGEMLKQAGEKDRVIIFFAGHGETFTTPDGGERGYLVPTEGKRDDLYLTSISMRELYDIAEISSAKHILYLVDACFSGLAISESRGLSKQTPSYLRTITTEKGRQIITAGDKDEEVFENSDWGHSAFTKNLLIGLGKGTADIDGDGIVTTNELGDFLTERVNNETDGAHTPQIGRIGTEMGELIFVFIPDNKTGNNTYNKFQKEKLINRNLYESAKKYSRVYPGLGHIKLGQKKKGTILALAETASLTMTVLSLYNFNKAHGQYLESKNIYDTAGFNQEGLGDAEENYLSDYDAYQMAGVQFGSAAFISLGIWIYNIYDIKKSSYNYTEKMNPNRYKISFSPLGKVQIKYNF